MNFPIDINIKEFKLSCFFPIFSHTHTHILTVCITLQNSTFDKNYLPNKTRLNLKSAQ